MKRLLWREFREKWYWAGLLIVAASTPVLFNDGYFFVGDIGLDRLTQWVLLPAGLALLFGLGTYSSELAGGTADFLFSRPVSWKRIIAAKLINALCIAIIAAIASAIVYRLMCPAPYIKFATPIRLTAGAGISAGIMIMGYLIGVAFSVVLPGTVGGLSTLIALAVLGAAAFFGTASFIEQFKVQSLMNVDAPMPVWSIAGLIAGALAAALMMSRFGITLTTAVRIKRYAIVLIPIALLISALDWEPQTRITGEDLCKTDRAITISPDGKFVLLGLGIPQHPAVRMELMRLSDRKKVRLPWSNCAACIWAVGDRVVACTNEASGHSITRIAWMTPNGQLRTKVIDPSLQLLWEGISPDHRIITLRQYERDCLDTSKSHPITLLFLDIVQGKLLKTKVNMNGQSLINVWWQSNTEVQYTVLTHKEQHQSSGLTGAPPLTGHSLSPRYKTYTVRVSRK